MNTTPNPGSDIAIKLGCQCAVMDNAYGRGYHFDRDAGYWLFVINGECPLHGKPNKTNVFIESVRSEIRWCIENPDKNLSAEYQKGFTNGLVQAVTIMGKVSEAMNSGDTHQRHGS